MDKPELDDMDLEELRHFHSSPELEEKLRELAKTSCAEGEILVHGRCLQPRKPPLPSLG